MQRNAADSLFTKPSNLNEQENQMMKKVLKGSVMALMVLFLSAGTGLAGNGKGSGQGSCGATGISIVCSGSPIEVIGVVSDLSYGGSGMVLSPIDGTDEVTIYGIGPYWYWDAKEIDRPVVGDMVAVSGMLLDFNGTQRIVAMSITVNTESLTIQLREPCGDGTGGQPLWSGGWRKQGQQ